jgi:L-seryl-tRNA(Ser) seleniumtransferase
MNSHSPWQAGLRELPAVHAVVAQLGDLLGMYPQNLVTEEVRRALASARLLLQGSPGAPVPDIAGQVRRNLAGLARPSLRRVINATGVVLHTNLGRAPLPDSSLPAGGYCNLEYDLEEGRRGKRDTHTSGVLERLLGVPALAVNNNAAATWLALNELAAGGEVIVSRGELIEIGDGFRIPDIMARSGAVLREVGTTNRTRVEDYQAAINERTRVIMIVHPSNFRIEGFTGKPSRTELAELARETGVPLYEDLGSGCLAELAPWGISEPRVQDSIAGGVSLVSFSGDKLLGGPQAGLLAGEPEIVQRLRRNPMFRALRLDKLILGMLETTLRYTLFEQWDRIPALRMISLMPESIRARALALVETLKGVEAEVIEGSSVIGGGSTPEQSIPTWLIAIAAPGLSAIERRLRLHDPPVVVRIEDGRVMIDLRTVLPDEEPELTAAILAAVRN